MTAGLPGAGIGGVFYLLTALLAPLCALVRRFRGSPRPDGARALRHFALAASMLAGIALTAWLVGVALAVPTARVVRIAPAPADLSHAQIVGRAMLFLTLGTLAAVLVAVEGLRLIVRARRRLHSVTGTCPPSHPGERQMGAARVATPSAPAANEAA